MVLAAVENDGWAVLKAGSMTAATFVAAVADQVERFAIAIAIAERRPPHDRP